MTGPTLHINDRKQIKRMKSLICLALLFLALSVRGQGTTLTGNVRDGKDQLALQDVNVVISSQGHKDITAYTISDQKGSFRLTYTSHIIIGNIIGGDIIFPSQQVHSFYIEFVDSRPLV